MVSPSQEVGIDRAEFVEQHEASIADAARILGVSESGKGISDIANGLINFEQPPQPDVASSSEPKDIIEINFNKGPSGFGFNIVGGLDAQHVPGENGIFVSGLKAGGSAQQDGRIQVGDKILSINGVQLDDVSHDEAVSACRIAPIGNVHIVLDKGAERRIVETCSPPFGTAGGSAGLPMVTNPLIDDVIKQQSDLAGANSNSAHSEGDSFLRRPIGDAERMTAGEKDDDAESVASYAPSTHSVFDDVPRTPKRPLSVFDPRNPSIFTEALYVSIGLAVISLGAYVGYRFIRGGRR